jgi:hypothetical protein
MVHLQYPIMSHAFSPFLVSLLVTLTFGNAFSFGQATLPKAIKTSNETVYTIKMETTFEVPENGRIEQLRVYHALPTLRPWSKSAEKYGATAVNFDAKIGKIETHNDTDSHYIVFALSPQQKPGTKLQFTSVMKITSVERRLDLTAAKVAWADYKAVPKDKEAVVNQKVKDNVHPELAKVAAGLKEKHAPPKAVQAAAAWVKDEIKYDASVPYPRENINEIMLNKKGHCGHQANVFEQLMASLGVPMRTVWGMNLYAPDGRTGELQKVRADFTNIHTWAEVYFSGIGWVEVDPNLGDKAFSLPAYLIQNNRWFQNYMIWFRDNNRDKQPTWTTRQGGFRSDYGVEHIISYKTYQK